MATPRTEREADRVVDPSHDASRAHRRYLLVTLGLVLAVLAAVSAFNLAVDPFLYFWPRPAWRPEPAYAAFDRETHYNLMVHARPNAVLLGNSQTQHGLVPSHWNAPGPVINAAAVGARLPEIRETLEAAERQRHISYAIVGLDFSMSHASPNPPPVANQMYLLAADGRPRLEQVKGLVTFPMLRSSAALVLEAARHRRNYGEQGEALDPVYQVSLDSHGGALGALKGRLAQFRESLRQPPTDFASEFRALRDTACQGGVHLQVYIAPTHAAWMQAIRQAGLEGAWLRWKRDLVAASREHPDCPFELWDFNTYNALTTEPLPAAGHVLRYSWDGVHFRTVTGDMILARMQDLAGAPQISPPSDFGVLLTPANIEEELSKVRRDGAAYQAGHRNLLPSLWKGR